jgi:DMSO/TMAO reductase YedYZ molybdopterin-dependent catalytic subunit
MIGAPLITVHLAWHLAAAWRSVARSAVVPESLKPFAEDRRGTMTRRSLLGGLGAIGLGLALAFQNTGLRSFELANLFVGRTPKEERGGPGDFPVETLFGKQDDVDLASYRLHVEGEVARPLALSYTDLLAMPAVDRRIRISCVSGWTERPLWRGPRVRDVLALARERSGTKSVAFHSLSGYGFTWHRDRLDNDAALLATHVNGAPLSTNHGFPVRLIVPGYPGQNMVKQIDRIFVRRDAEEFHPDFRII